MWHRLEWHQYALFIQKNRLEIGALILLFSVGIFFRTTHFSEWLHFEVDQVYDITSVAPAVDDISSLPLLGPVAAGGPLRLGPAYYYLQYLSASLLGNTPVGHAGAVLFFSLLSLIVFYFFCRKFFSLPVALGLLLLFASSFYMVLYARFSWNPNILPFFVLFSFYALLASVDQSEKYRNIWFLIFAGSIGITIQLHFNALFILLPIVGIFFLLNRPSFSLRHWILALFLLSFSWMPVFANEIITGGENTRFFQSKILGEPEAGVDTTDSPRFLEKAFQIIRYDAYEYFLILTGNDQINNARPNGFSLGLSCEKCAEKLPFRISALLLFSSEVLVLFFLLWKECDTRKKNFYLLLTLWLLVSSLYFLTITYNGLSLYPRFFLIVSPLPFFLLGLLLERFFLRSKIFGGIVLFSSVCLVSFLNIGRLQEYFHLLTSSSTQAIEVETEDVFPHIGRITLSQQYAIVDLVQSMQKENALPIYLKSELEYEPAFWYHFEDQGMTRFYQLRPGISYGAGNYFLVIRTASKVSKEFRVLFEEYDFREAGDFGSLKVYSAVIPASPGTPSLFHDSSYVKSSLQPAKSQRVRTLGDVFGIR